VSLSMVRELAPVLSGLIVAGRAGSAMGAELGTMRVTEQIDALEVMATDPVHYLVVPRVWAGTIMLPLLVLLGNGVGILGGYLVAVVMMGANPVTYIDRTYQFMDVNDVFSGLIKAAVFGFLLAAIGCQQGFYTSGGAEGVGRSTTAAVVVASIAILVADFFLTRLLF
jgi:phospholipid/cholesterol/gamma-HCH transport system permease protein